PARATPREAVALELPPRAHLRVHERAARQTQKVEAQAVLLRVVVGAGVGRRGDDRVHHALAQTRCLELARVSAVHTAPRRVRAARELVQASDQEIETLREVTGRGATTDAALQPARIRVGGA